MDDEFYYWVFGQGREIEGRSMMDCVFWFIPRYVSLA